MALASANKNALLDHVGLAFSSRHYYSPGVEVTDGMPGFQSDPVERKKCRILIVTNPVGWPYCGMESFGTTDVGSVFHLNGRKDKSGAIWFLFVDICICVFGKTSTT